MRFYKKINRIAPLVLLGMAFMRMIWLELRSYEPVLQPRSAIAIRNYVPPKGCKGFEDIPIYAREDTGPESPLFRNRSSLPQTYFPPAVLYYYDSQCAAKGKLDARTFVSINHNLYLMTVIVSSAMVRLLSGSWVLALGASVILLSRGHLTANLGSTGTDYMVSAIYGLWILLLVYFFRSGSAVFALAAFIVLGLGIFVEPALVLVLLVLPVLLSLGVLMRSVLWGPLVERLRRSRKQIGLHSRSGILQLYEGGVVSSIVAGLLSRLLFREPNSAMLNRFQVNTSSLMVQRLATEAHWLGSLSESFGLWILKRRRWRVQLLSWLIGFMLMSFIVAQMYVLPLVRESAATYALPTFILQFMKAKGAAWFVAGLATYDLHLIYSITVILFAAFLMPSKGLKHVFEVVWMILISLAALFVSVFLFDALEFWWLSGGQVEKIQYLEIRTARIMSYWTWTQASILAVALVCVYHLILMSTSDEKTNKGLP